MKMRKTEDSAFAVKQASVIADMATLPLHQQSLIYGFLQQYDKVNFLFYFLHFLKRQNSNSALFTESRESDVYMGIQICAFIFL